MSQPRQAPSMAAVAHRVVIVLVAVLVLLQAVLAGQSDRLFGTITIDVHGQIANVIFLLVLANVALGWRAGVRGARFVVLAALVVAVSAQTGLGYAGRTSLDAAAWHVPTGVVVFGLAVASLTLSLGNRTGRPALQ